MFQCPGSNPSLPPKRAGWPWFPSGAGLLFLLLFSLGLPAARAQINPALAGPPVTTPFLRPDLTNTFQFKNVSAAECLDENPFRLQGVVTLVDTNRSLLVLQDATGPLALHCDVAGAALQPGRRVLLQGPDFYPYVTSFPDYPWHPSGRELRTSFEGPTDWGEYYLSRYRGWLRPPVTGDYTFWIASDNSSQLLLSSDETPAREKAIASISDFTWAKPREWSKFPSQRSEPVHLEAGRKYYLEALHEQSTKGDNLAVAWSGPGLEQAVIDGRYLEPWPFPAGANAPAPTNGLWREYWTNYSAGNLRILSGAVPTESIFSVPDIKLDVLGHAALPPASTIVLGQPLPGNQNFSRVQTEGTVQFLGINGPDAEIELVDGGARVRVHVSQWAPPFGTSLVNTRVRVVGICEGGHDDNGVLVPVVIWASGENCLVVSPPAATRLNASGPVPSPDSGSTNTAPGIGGYYSTAGVVTFSDQVLGKDCLFVQSAAAAIALSLSGRHYQNHFAVGQWLQLGGSLLPGRYVPVMSPMVVSAAGWHSLPDPVVQPLRFPLPASRDGLWSEIAGVVHRVNANGTLSLWVREGQIDAWIGQTSPSAAQPYVDAKVRVRGVLSLTTLDTPVLLVPSRSFVQVVEASPPDPFNLPLGSVSGLPPEPLDYSTLHRVKIRGVATYSRGNLIFLQDASGGIRVRMQNNLSVNPGQSLEVVGFPQISGPAKLLTSSLVRFLNPEPPIHPAPLDVSSPAAPRPGAALVQVTALLLNQKTIGASQQLELEDHQRLFTATLADSPADLPSLASGSRVRVTGVLDDGFTDLPPVGPAADARAGAPSLNLLLRSPADVAVLQDPPWWTLKRTLALVGALLTVLVVVLLWVWLLERRLARQQAARLMFSRQILQGQESERHRIAVNLHDSLGQDLLVIKNQLRLAMQSAGDEPGRQTRLRKISEITSQAIEEVRQITHDLRPYQLDRLGLTQAIRAVVNQAADNSPVQIATGLDAIDNLFSKESEIHLYRIVQEALNNLLKHSAATEAAVVIKNLPAEVALSIRDNGRGFDPDLAGSTSVRDIGYGLIGMKERVRILGGRLEILSRPGQGATITIEIPKPVAKLSPA